MSKEAMRTKSIAGPSALLLAWVAGGFAGTSGAASVARVSVIASGDVLLTSAGETTTEKAAPNAPLWPGDAFATNDPNTRAELQLDGFTDLRLGGGVKARITDNDTHARRIEMTSGLVELAVLRGGDVATEIVTPSFTLRTRYAGDYRLSLKPDGTASVTPRSGQAEVLMARRTLTIDSGEALVLRGSAENALVRVQPADASDAFDAFNAQRDRTLLAALEGDTHVPASIAGYDDLSAYGRWANVATYGQVWVPNVQSSDWAPYRDGRWSYIGNDGWTWIGSEPWGWIPYHYGRWLYSAGYNWCWYPPPVGFNPTWAPALVGFFGFGDDSLGFPNFGWVPLAPFEIYTSWHPSRRYYPPPPAPARHRDRDERTDAPAAEFRNARFGGSSTVSAEALRKVDVTAAHGTQPSLPTSALPSIHVTPVQVPPAGLTLPTVTPVLHESTPRVHGSSYHPPP
jgi:hypothetical protein